jgi:enoyl-CoA hydratase
MTGQIFAQRDALEVPGLLLVTLAHEGKFNAMSRCMWADLKAVFEEAQSDPEVRCILLRGKEGHFCAGGDIAEYPSFRFDEAQLRHFHEHEVWGGLQAMLNCDVPIVAQIEGNCMGAGMELACCCDLRLAAEGARFGAPIARLGFPMAPREAALVSRVAGETIARAMLLGAEVFDAREMKAHGFLTRIHPNAELAEASFGMAKRIAHLAPKAARLNKQTLRAATSALECEVAATSLPHPYGYAESAEHREGIGAFLAKRQPEF